MVSPGSALIVARNLGKAYRMGTSVTGEGNDHTVQALSDVSFEIATGEFVAIMGASGSGKSTLMNILGCLDLPTQGRYWLAGEEVENLDADALAAIRNRRVGFVFQQFNLLPRTTALENVELPMVYAGVRAKERHIRALEALTQVGLADRAGHTAAELSGGQQQRVSIARALVNRPSLILADEPTGALDSHTSEDIMRLLAGLNAQGITVVIVTHESDIAAWARRKLVFRDGQLVDDVRQSGLSVRPGGADAMSVAGPSQGANAPSGGSAVHAVTSVGVTLPMSVAGPSQGANAPSGGSAVHAVTSVGVTFRLALRALAANTLRSFLTMLGIIIGVAAVITMIAVGSGATQRVQEQMKGLGSNIMLVLPGGVSQAGVRLGAQTRQRLTEEDALAIALEIPDVQVAAPTSRTSGQLVVGNTNWGTSIIGVNNDYLEAREWPLASGRMFDAAELAGSAKVAWIGATVARELFGDQDPVEQMIRVRNIPMTVIGVLSPKGQNSMGQDQDDAIMIPLSTLRNRIWGGDATSRLKRVGGISVKVQAGRDMKVVEESIKDLLRQRFKVQPGSEDPFQVRNLTEVLRAQEESSRVMTLLLAAVAGISLGVGGIGIMNIMLVSVTERTREIGLRMAVGARARDILSQFLIEAVTLSLMGGLLGVLLGAAATWAMGRVAGWQVALSVGSVALAVGFSGCVGIFFGYYPARRASRLLPVYALRYE